jgi:hypothetical protein
MGFSIAVLPQLRRAAVNSITVDHACLFRHARQHLSFCDGTALSTTAQVLYWSRRWSRTERLARVRLEGSGHGRVEVGDEGMHPVAQLPGSSSSHQHPDQGC